MLEESKRKMTITVHPLAPFMKGLSDKSVPWQLFLGRRSTLLPTVTQKSFYNIFRFIILRVLKQERAQKYEEKITRLIV